MPIGVALCNKSEASVEVCVALGRLARVVLLAMGCAPSWAFSLSLAKFIS